MTMTTRTAGLSLAFAFAATILAAPAEAQRGRGAAPVPTGPPPPATTSFGAPNLQGIWGPRFVQSLNENAPWLPEAYKAFKALEEAEDPLHSCKPPGVPRVLNMNFPFEIVQTPEIVYILAEYDQHVRRVFINGTHPKDPDPTWLGYSIGKWEGKTLVVETIGFNDVTWLDMRGHLHSEDLKVTERFTRSDDGRTLTHEMTIDDPKTYSKPWSYTKTHPYRPDMKINEFICETGD